MSACDAMPHLLREIGFQAALAEAVSGVYCGVGVCGQLARGLHDRHEHRLVSALLQQRCYGTTAKGYADGIVPCAGTLTTRTSSALQSPGCSMNLSETSMVGSCWECKRSWLNKHGSV